MTITKKQKKLADVLESFAPKIAKTYLGGIKVLENKYDEKLSQSAHSFREVIDEIRDNKEFKKLGRQKKKKEKIKPIKKLAKNLDPLGETPESMHYLYDDLWNKYREYFLGIAHHGKFPEEKQFRKKVQEFETLLGQIVRPHFEVIKDMDKIFSKKTPTKKEFKEMKPLIARNLSSYNYFFQNASSDWFAFANKNKYFDKPKHVIKDSKGIRYPVWFQGNYLARVARKKPKEVSRIILNFKMPKQRGDRNPWILDDFIKAALAMDPKYGRKIATKISKEHWMDNQYQIVLEKTISELMMKLAEANCEKEAILLANSLLDVTLGQSYAKGGILEKYEMVKDVKPVLDSYWYEQLLLKEIQTLYDKFPYSIIELLIDLVNLTIYLENKGRNHPKTKEDASAGWRPAIEPHEQNWERDFRSELVGTLGGLLVNEGQRSIPSLKKELQLIKKKVYPVFRRLELHVYRQFPKQFKKEIEKAIINCFNDWNLHHEYYHLLKATFPNLPKPIQRKYLALVEKGPEKDLLDLWKAKTEYEKPGYVKLRLQGWKSGKLEPIHKFLTGKDKENYEKLIAAAGQHPFPDLHAHFSGVKMSQPVTDLKDYQSSDEVISFVKSHKEEEKSFGFHDGTADKFQELVKKNPEEYINRIDELRTAKPIFHYKFLRGLDSSLKEDKNFEWKNVLEFCDYIIDLTKKNKYKSPNGYNTLVSIANLLGTGLRNNSIKFQLRKETWKILESLNALVEKDLSPKEEDYPAEPWDAYGTSINSSDGQTLHAIMAYALWCSKHLKTDTKGVFVPEVKKIFSDYLDEKLTNTISRHAVLGINLQNLFHLDTDWTRTKLSNLFHHKQKPLCKAAWDSYLLNNVHGFVFRQITKEYMIHIKKLDAPQFRESDQLMDFDKQVIQHATTAYLFKIKEAEPLFNALLNKSHEKVLAHCSWVIGRILKDLKEKPSPYFDLNAMKKLWVDSKLTGNEETTWWFEESPFSRSETIKLLLKSLKKTKGKLKFPSLIVKKLDSYAKTHPVQTVECLDLIIRNNSQDSEAHLIRGELRKVLEVLMKSKNKNAITKTRRLIHYLGEINYNEYKDLL